MVAMSNGLNDHCVIQCCMCGRLFSIMYNIEHMTAWLCGSGYIQDIMPYLTSGERELFLSSTCSDCFDKLYMVDNDV
jgi:hypothetical protein